MKTKICKILNIVVLIYIFNAPIITSQAQELIDENVVITTPSIQEITDESIANTLNTVDATDSVIIAEQSQVEDSAIPEIQAELIAENPTSTDFNQEFIDITNQTLDSDQLLYTDNSQNLVEINPVDINLQQLESENPEIQSSQNSDDITTQNTTINTTEYPSFELDIIQPNQEEVEAIESSVETLEVIQPNQKEIEAIEAPEETLEVIQPNQEEIEAIEASVETPEVIQPNQEEIESIESSVETLEVIQPNQEEIEAIEAPVETPEVIQPNQEEIEASVETLEVIQPIQEEIEAIEASVETPEVIQPNQEEIEAPEETLELIQPNQPIQPTPNLQENLQSNLDQSLNSVIDNTTQDNNIYHDQSYQNQEVLLVKDVVQDIKTQEFQENKTEQNMYTDENKLADKLNTDLDIQAQMSFEATNQRPVDLVIPEVFIEFLDTKIQSEDHQVKLSSLDEIIEDPKINIVLESKEFSFSKFDLSPRIVPQEVINSNLSEPNIELNYEQISKQDFEQALAFESKKSNTLVFASLSLKSNLDRSHKTDLSNLEFDPEEALLTQNSLEFLDKIKVTDLPSDLDHNGCVDSIQNNLEFASICNFLHQNTNQENLKPQLNLSSSNNVFNTQKIILNGVVKANSKFELHAVSVDNDKILSILESDKNGNFIYLLDSALIPKEGQFYLKDINDQVSDRYDYSFDFSKNLNAPDVIRLCDQEYTKDSVVLCNPKQGFDIKMKSNYQTATKAYFNSVIHTGLTITNNLQNIAVLNPDKGINQDLKSGEIHRVILQSFNPLQPDVLSEPIEIFYKVHYPIINPVLLPLIVLLFILAVVILYDYLIYSYQSFNTKLIYESYQVFKNSDIKPSSN